MNDPIIHVSDYCRAMGIDHLGDLWRLEPGVRRERFAAFEREVAAGRIKTHGHVQPSTPLKLTDPIAAALDDADLSADRQLTKEHRSQLVKDGVPQKFDRLHARRQEAYIREHDLDPQEASWHALNDLCRQSDDDLRIWARRLRAARLVLVLRQEVERA